MIRIGLLGASKIAVEAMIAPSLEIDGVAVTCVAARNLLRATAYADKHNIPAVEPSYDALIANDDIDLIYNGLPPSEHARWSIAALRGGKHVLCEKPIALNAKEAQAMVQAATDSRRYLLEAFHYRHHPAFGRFLNILAAGSIGPVQRADARFDVPIKCQKYELRYDLSLGGGAMMDLGCYPVHWVRQVIQSEPIVETAEADWHATGVDVAMRAKISFPGGEAATVSVSMAENLPSGVDAELTVTGTNGRLTIVNPLVPHTGHLITLERNGDLETEQVSGRTTYFHQLCHVKEVLEGRAAPLTGGHDAVANMRIIDAVYYAAGRRCRS